MKKLIFILTGALAVLAGGVAAVWFWLFWTPPGRDSLRSLIESEISDALNSHVEIGEISGALPKEIILHNISFNSDIGEWLRIDEVKARWRPFALLKKRIEVDAIAIGPAQLSALPPRKARDEKKPRGFTLPQSLPNVEISEIGITALDVSPAVSGTKTRLNGGGRMRLGGMAIDIDLTLKSENESDAAIIRAVRTGDALTTAIEVHSVENGALAALARLGGKIHITADGEGPLADYRLAFAGTLGAYGDVDGEIAGDLERMETLALSANATLGEKLANTSRIIGGAAQASAIYSPTKDGGALSDVNFSSALGSVSGALSWHNKAGSLDRVHIEAAAEIAADWRPDIRPYIGDALSVKGDIRPRNGAYVATGNAEATYFDAALEEIATDLRDYARGPAHVTLKPNPALPGLISEGGEAKGEFNLLFGDTVDANAFSFLTPDGGVFNGAASYAFDTKKFTVKGEIAAAPAMIARVAPGVKSKLKASGVIDLKGASEDFGGTLVASLPPLLVNKAPFPAARLSLALANAPHASSGQINVRTIDGKSNLSANFAQSADGAWRANAIDLIGEKFALKGSAELNAGEREISLDLAYRGVEGAEPWPGFPLVGEFTAKGAIARGDKLGKLTVKSSSLATKRWSLSGLVATAEGPPDRLAISADISQMKFSGTAPVKDLSMKISAALGDISRFTVDALTADIESAPVKLLQPAKIEIGDDLQIDGVRAQLGRRGSLNFDGAFGKSRWRGRLTAVRAPIVSAASVVDLDLDFDTDRKTPATGAFSMTSLLTKTAQATFAGRLVWDGKALAINDDGSSEAIDLSLSLPMRLARSPALSIDTKGDLRGTAHYKGRVETIAGFLPSALQTIEGDLTIDGAATGTLERPKLTGEMNVSGGAFTELATGFSIVNIDASAAADAALEGSRIKFKATGAGVRQSTKTIASEGVLTIGAASTLASKLTFDKAKLSAGPVTEVEATGAIDISGPVNDLLAKGEITVSSLDARVFTPETTGLVDIRVVSVNGDGENVTVEEGVSAASAVALALKIKGDDRIFIRGRGLESEWRADVSIDGRADAPVVLGAMRLKNGEITFAGRRFELTTGEIAFDRLAVNNPTLDIRAERQTKSGTLAAIVIEGRASTPKISLSSTPSLPQEDIMALVLFDKPANELSALESLQVAEGLAELGGIGPFGGNGITGSARQALGLDLLNFDIDQDDSSASSLTVGKYVADGLFVSATQDARGENGSVRVEYEIDQSFTVETELRQDGDQKASVNWKHDF